MRITQIEQGVVINVLEVSASAIPPEMRGWPEATDGVGIGWTYEDGVFAPPLAPAPSAGQVKQEAARRILALVPEWKQRNLTARAVTLAEKGRDNWTADEIAEWAAGEALWLNVQAIRAASDLIEAMDPIPADYTDDTHWPEV